MSDSANIHAQKRAVLGQPGIGVDFVGGQVVDPTKNVAALVEATAAAQGDLRIADNRYYDAVMSGIKEMNLASHFHLAEMAGLRAEYSKEIRDSDLKVSAQTRTVDVQAGNAQQASLATAVQALATGAARDAETLRNAVTTSATALAKQVADAAAATAIQTANSNAAMEKRISDLEKMSNLGAGKSSVADPQMERLTESVALLVKLQEHGGGKTEGVTDSFKLLNGAVLVVVALLSIGSFIYSSNRSPVAPLPSGPQPVYVIPAPVTK